MQSELEAWEEAFAKMCGEQDALVNEGRWRNGQHTLLQAIGLQYDEVKLCAGLAWLLRPDSWHGLGTRFLDAVLAELDFDASQRSPVHLARATVAVEERRDNTRADVVIRVPNTGVVVIEAKVRAGEQDDQADRLYQLWSDESPRYVFLTRHGGRPSTATASEGSWTVLTWTRLHELLMPLRDDAAPGAKDLIDTFGFLGS
jgi:hypothetical protein